MTIYLIQCGQTEWRAQGRIQGRLSLPLTAIGLEEAESLARQLASVKLEAIYRASCQACQQTADAVAGQPGQPKVREVEDLAEIDMGLWQGMLAEEIKRRQAKVYRQWREEPERVTPPSGENLGSAYERIVATLNKLVRKHEAGEVIGIVVAPMAAAMLRCHLGHHPLAEIWQHVRLAAGPAEQFPIAPAENG